MNKRTLLIALLPLCLALGCGADLDNSDEANEAARHDEQARQDGINPDTGEPLFTVTLNANAPAGIVGDFLVKGDVACEATDTCEVKVVKIDDQVEIELESPIHLFAPREYVPNADDNGTVVELNWTEEGSWGLAPNGAYVDSSNDSVRAVETGLDGDRVFMNMGLNVMVHVTGAAFYGEKPGVTLEGTISDDLSLITYKLEASNGNVSEGTLTKQ